MAQFGSALQTQPHQTFPFSKDFQLNLLGLMFQDYEFLTYAHEIIHPDYFSDDILAWYFSVIKDHFLDYQERITELVLRNELSKAVRNKKIKQTEIPSYVSAFKKIKQTVGNKGYFVSELTTFCQHQAIIKACLEVPDLLDRQDFDQIKARWEAALQVGMVNNIGTEYFIDYPERIRGRQERRHRIMPTGITQIDDYLNGGLKPKQLGIWMGPVNRGKTIALMQCAKRCIIAGGKVIHYTLEMSEEEVSERYDSAFSRIPMNLLGDREGDLLRFLHKEGVARGHSLIIKEYSTKRATVGTLLAHFRMCVQAGFIPDLVVVDYLDLVKPACQRAAKREELTDISEEMRGAAGETDVPWWTGTQSRRAAISMELHTEEEVGEDIGKINTADVAITLNQTQDELHQHIMRAFIAKNRNGVKYRTVKFATDFERMCFYDPFATAGLATSSGKPDSSLTGKGNSKPKRKPAKRKHSPVTGGLIRT